MSMNLDPLHKFSNPELNRPASAADAEALASEIDAALSHPDAVEIITGSFSGTVGNVHIAVNSRSLFNHDGDREQTIVRGLIASLHPELANQAMVIHTQSDAPGEVELIVGKEEEYKQIDPSSSQAIGYSALTLIQAAIAADRDGIGTAHLHTSAEYKFAERMVVVPFSELPPELSPEQIEDLDTITRGLQFDINDARNAVFEAHHKRRVLRGGTVIEVSNPRLIARRDDVDQVQTLHAMDVTQSDDDFSREKTRQLAIDGRSVVYPIRTKILSYDKVSSVYEGGLSAADRTSPRSAETQRLA